MSHVDEGTLHAYLDGELPSTERAAVDAHLADCATCRGALGEARALLERATALLGSVRPVERAMPPFEQLRRAPKRSPWRVRTPFAWAASIALALGLGYSLRDTEPAALVPAPLPESATLARSSETAPAATTDQAKAPARQETRVGARRATAPAEESVLGYGGRRDEAMVEPPIQVRGVTPEPQPAPAVAAQRDSITTTDAIVVSGALGRAAAVPRDLTASSWQIISRGAAASLLGTDPVGVPGLATRRIRRSPAPDGVVVVEQALDSTTVIRFFQRPASAPFNAYQADTMRVQSRLMERSREGAPAPARASAAAASGADRLARFVGRLRVEISGPLSPDSLNKLLEQVEPLP